MPYLAISGQNINSRAHVPICVVLVKPVPTKYDMTHYGKKRSRVMARWSFSRGLKMNLTTCEKLAILICLFIGPLVTRTEKWFVLLAYTFDISCHTRPLTIYDLSKIIGYIPLMLRALKPCQNLAIVIFLVSVNIFDSIAS